MTFSRLTYALCLLLTELVIASSASAAPAVIGGVSYETVDDGEPFLEAPVPSAFRKTPDPYGAERRSGLMPFVAEDPGDYVPNRAPEKAERIKALDVFVSPGETTCFSFGIYGLRKAEGFSTNLALGNAPVSIEQKYLHCWPQRTGWNSRQWRVIPELLLPFSGGKRSIPAKGGVLSEEAFNLDQGKTVGLWFTVKAPVDARPGRYRVVLSLCGRGEKPFRLPIKLEVLPIQLRRPEGKNWLLYGDSFRWTTMNDDQAIAEIKDFVAHGFNGLVEAPFGSVDLSDIRNGRAGFDARPYRKFVEQCKAAGMPGPHVCQMGGVPEHVRDALGIHCDLAKDVWPEELREGVAAVAQAAVRAMKDAGAPWYFYGVDEPKGDNTYAIQEYQCWHDAGARTYATFYQLDFLDKASAFLTTPCFVTGLVSKEEKAKEAREACERTGSEFWWYGTGCYVNPSPQESGMFFNRYGAGVFFWKTGAKAQVTWTFCRPHADVFNDFDGTPQNSAEPKDQVTAYPHFLRPNDWSTYQGAIPTVAWESLREGYNDYLYLNTLAEAIKQARAANDKALARKADRAEKAMAELVNGVPWQNPMNRPDARQKALTSQRLQQVRRCVADQILALQ